MTEQGDQIPWRHRLSLRLRITLFTALVVAVVMAVGGLAILATVRAKVLNLEDDVGKIRAEEVAQLATDGELPTALPTMRSPATYVEVVSDGHLVTATSGLDESNSFDLPEVDAGETTVSDVDRLPLNQAGPYVVTSYGVDAPSGHLTIFAAVPSSDLDDTLETASGIGTIGIAVLVLVLSVILWFALGRALAPVDDIRARADAITGRNLQSRVPVSPRRDEISRLARTVNRMLERLQRSADRQRRFVDDAAHELRSPVTSLRVQLETARDHAAGPRREEDLLLEVGRMERLVDQLLLLARVDADKPWFQASGVDLDDVVDSAVASLTADQQVRVDTSQVEPVQVSGDADLLEQVVRNLVHNALRFARDSVQVSVTRTAEGRASLIVDDDGPGIPPDRREEVFGRFVRLDASRDREHGGVGLGLAIVAEIVQAHEARIQVSDSPLGGARFTVEFPVDPVVDDQSSVPSNAMS